MKRFAAPVGLVVASLMVGLVVAEMGVRLASSVSPALAHRMRGFDPFAVLVEPVGEFGYRQRPNSTYEYGNGTAATSNTQGFRGPPVARPKPTGTYRIVLLGGSTTHGWGVDDGQAIDDYMRDILAERLPARSFDVVNLAFDGYDSYQLVERLQAEGLDLQPDLVIINSGINDVRNSRFPELRVGDERTLIWEAVMRRLRDERERGGPRLWTRIKHYLYGARLPGILLQSLRYRSPAEGQDAPPPPPQVYPDAMRYFERNLRRLAQLADSVDIPILFSNPPSSLGMNYQPDDTSHQGYWIGDAATTQEYRDSLVAITEDLSRTLAQAGQPVRYVSHQLSGDMFLDDCHLTAEGNEELARDFVEAAITFLDDTT